MVTSRLNKAEKQYVIEHFGRVPEDTKNRSWLWPWIVLGLILGGLYCLMILDVMGVCLSKGDLRCFI